MSDRARIDLNTVQIVASMGAAVTGAILTSYLGDGGTIMGTAVGSGVSAAGFAIYKHYLGRTKEKVAPVIAGHARQWSPTTQASSRRAAVAGQTGPAPRPAPAARCPATIAPRPDRGQADARQPESLGRLTLAVRIPGWPTPGMPPPPRRCRRSAPRTHGRHRPRRAGQSKRAGAAAAGTVAATGTVARPEPPGPAGPGRRSRQARPGGRRQRQRRARPPALARHGGERGRRIPGRHARDHADRVRHRQADQRHRVGP